MDDQAGPSRPRRSSSFDDPALGELRSSNESNRAKSNDPPGYDDVRGSLEDQTALLSIGNGKGYAEEEPDGMERMSAESTGAKARHLASIEQKKALWWRNVIVTGIFIASWWVDILCHCLASSMTSISPRVVP